MGRIRVVGIVMEDDGMAKRLVTDALWELVEPLLPVHERGRQGGAPRIPDRVCLTGILFVLKTGMGWEDFPQEMGCCGMTLWNRLHEWQREGVWDQIHRVLLDKLRGADRLDFSRAVIDSSSVRAVLGGLKPAPIPRIVAKKARNIMCLPTAAACRWPLRSRRPMPMMSRN
jgi:transposase